MNPVLSLLAEKASRHLRSLQANGQELNLWIEAPLRQVSWGDEGSSAMTDRWSHKELAARPLDGLSWTQVDELCLNDE